jgi:hypothetical protein
MLDGGSLMNWCQFWIQTGVQGVGVVATLLLAVLAIWGESLRARFTGPRLTVRLFKVDGELTQLGTGAPARYYHLRVENLRPSDIILYRGRYPGNASSKQPVCSVVAIQQEISSPDTRNIDERGKKCDREAKRRHLNTGSRTLDRVTLPAPHRG